eukprot:181700-Pyramimonas_sp.AAC.1
MHDRGNRRQRKFRHSRNARQPRPREGGRWGTAGQSRWAVLEKRVGPRAIIHQVAEEQVAHGLGARLLALLL